ncbi:hypothetical protein ABZ626_21255 [Streptomyces longispororuber]|uniref:hypothetical protein n=1 Tax=Streptomyces longispororuber TaxID=68230 RepID=UPI0033F21560
MPTAYLRGLADFVEAFEAVDGDGFEEPVARAGRGVGDADEGPVDQAGEEVEDLVGGEGIVGADRFGGVQGAAVGVDGEATQDGLLGGGEQFPVPSSTRKSILESSMSNGGDVLGLRGLSGELIRARGTHGPDRAF